MTHPFRITQATAVLAASALLAPGLAAAQGGDGPGRGSGPQAGGQVPARVQAKVKRVVRTLDRVQDQVDDGEDAAAVTALTRLDRATAAAQGVALKRVGTDNGPAVVARVAAVQDDVAVTTAELLDGASGDVASGLEGALDGALDDRDALVAAVGALSDHDDYGRAMARVAAASTDEAEAFTEGASDDELTTDAKAALTAGATQATATAAAATALAGDDADTTGDGASATRPAAGGDKGDCPGQNGSDTAPSGTTAGSQDGLSRQA